MTMNKTTKVMALAFTMFAMTGMLGFTGNSAFATHGGGGAAAGPHGVGSGGFQLNLIGQDRTSDATCNNNGHRIFVPLDAKFKIFLTEGPFKVLDCNALDSGGKVASFQLPNPADGEDPCTGTTCNLTYQVWVRVLGNPNPEKTVVIGPTCATEKSSGDEFCSTETIDVKSANGPGKKAKFTNVTKVLLTLCIDTTGDDKCDTRIVIFDDEFQDFFWNFDNQGARIIQLRFVQGDITIS